MFKITPVQDVTTAAECCRICGRDYVPGAFVYAMRDCDTDDLMGICQFEILGSCGYIYSLTSVPDTDDFEAMFILGRQAMNFIDLCGTHECRADLKCDDSDMLRAIGFKESSNMLICDMRGMFDGSHCSGH